MVEKERTLGSPFPPLISLKDERNFNQAISQDLPTLFSARKMQVSVYVTRRKGTAMTGCSLSARLITLMLLSAPY